jgi:Ca-activated chloride channel family protein
MNRTFNLLTLLILISSLFAFADRSFAQAKPQRPIPGNEKKNQRPLPKTEEELQKEAEERKRKLEEQNAKEEPGVIPVETNVVNVDAVVYNKKTGQIVTGLKKENFQVFEDGVKKDISTFTTPEAPITVTLVLE